MLHRFTWRCAYKESFKKKCPAEWDRTLNKNKFEFSTVKVNKLGA